MIRRITERGELDAARETWRWVFQTADPFTWPFRSDIGCGRLLFPTDGCHLNSSQYAALMGAIADNRENGFLIAIVESESDNLGQGDLVAWCCESPSYQEYSELNITLENAIFSQAGQWGLIISHEMHGILGATEKFISAFNASAGMGLEDKEAFALQWRAAEHQTWLAAVLARTK